LVVGLTSTLVASCPKKTSGVHTARQHAKPWKTAYHEVFDDELDHRTLATLDSDEPFALKAKELLHKRVGLADIVLVGEVLNVADMMRSDGEKRRGVLVEVKRILRGDKESLPQGDGGISLFLSEDHPRFRARKMVGRSVILFLRWLPGRGEPAFHWHCNVADPQLVSLVESLLKRRRQGRSLKAKKGSSAAPPASNPPLTPPPRSP
jgi:hypothetical protein